jgi:hypothetical protein
MLKVQEGCETEYYNNPIITGIYYSSGNGRISKSLKGR